MVVSSTAFHDVPGMLYIQEGDTLRKLAEGRHVLEIGPHMGRSTVAMAASARSILSIDTFEGDRMAPPALAENYVRNVANAGANGIATHIEGDFFVLNSQGDVNLTIYDFIFYDANHEPPNPYEKDFFDLVVEEIGSSASILNYRTIPRIIAIHDYKPAEPEFRYVVEAADEFTRLSGAPMQGNQPENGSVRWWEVRF